MNDEQQTTSASGSKSNWFLKLVSYLLVAAVVGGAVAYLIKTKPELLGLSKGQVQAQAEADRLISDIGKLIELPSDEKPTIATVSDVEKVKEQVFFKNAKNGDKVLIYTNAKKAILYRPSENRIVEVGAVNINQQPQASATPGSQATSSPAPTE